MSYNAQLAYTLACANYRYSCIAREMRKGLESRRHMHHTRLRLRAAWIGLRVNTKAAIALDGAKVSKIPMPILDTNPSPIPATAPYTAVPTRPSALHHPVPLPDITTTAPSPVAPRIPPIVIPSRAVRAIVGNTWGVPGAPLMKTRDLPALSPQGPSSPMTTDSGSSFLIPSHQNSLTIVQIPRAPSLQRRIAPLLPSSSLASVNLTTLRTSRIFLTR